MNDSVDDRLRLITALVRVLARSAGPAAVYAAVAEAAGRLFAASVARVWVNDPGRAVLTAAGSFGVDAAVEQELLDFTAVAHGEGIPGRIAQTRTAEYIADSRDDPRWVNQRFIQALELRAYVGLPLVAGDTVVGVLSVLFSQARTFSPDDRMLMELLADHAALAVQRARLVEDAELRRRIAEAASERYRALFERNLAGMFRMERDGRMIECNAAFARLLGHREPNDVFRCELRDFFADASASDGLLGRLATDRRVTNETTRWKRAGGDEITVLLNVAQSGDGPTAQLEGIVLDISDRQRAEVAERTAAALQAVAALANAAAHEINNPLTVIVGHLTLLSSELSDHRRIEMSLRAVEQIQDIVRRMHRVTRVTIMETSSPGLPPMLDLPGSSDAAVP